MSVRSFSIGKLVIATALVLQGAAVLSDETDVFGASSVNNAFALYEAGDYKEAALKLEPFAQEGNARAQLYLATLYRTGNGVEEGEYEAAKWYEKAAESGVAEAQFHLGLMYLEGLGVTEDTGQALEWISRAAQQGFGDAIDVFRYMLNHDEALDC